MATQTVTIGSMRSASRLRKGYAVLHAAGDSSGKQWKTITDVWQITAPLKVTTMFFDDGSERSVASDTRLFTRSPGEVEKAGHEGDHSDRRP